MDVELVRTIHKSGGLASNLASVGVMGIRFYCPNGHKLNVKEFQAGRKGICPFCGAKIQIPTESTRPSTREEAARGGGRASTGPSPTISDDLQSNVSISVPASLQPGGMAPQPAAGGPTPFASAPMGPVMKSAASPGGMPVGTPRMGAFPGAAAPIASSGSPGATPRVAPAQAPAAAPTTAPRARCRPWREPLVPGRRVDDVRRSPRGDGLADRGPRRQADRLPPVAAGATSGATDPLTEAGDVVSVCASRVGRPVWSGRLRNHANLARRRPSRRRFARLAGRMARVAGCLRRLPSTTHGDFHRLRVRLQFRGAARSPTSAELSWHVHDTERPRFGGMKDWLLIFLLTAAVIIFMVVFFPGPLQAVNLPAPGHSRDRS